MCSTVWLPSDICSWWLCGRGRWIFSGVAVAHSGDASESARVHVHVHVRAAKSQVSMNHVKRARIHFSSHYYRGYMLCARVQPSSVCLQASYA